MKNKTYFQFTSQVFGSYYQDQFVLLDLMKNEYFSLDDKTGCFLLSILTSQFQFKNSSYVPLRKGNEININNIDELNSYICEFSERGFIEPCTTEENKKTFTKARLPIGLSKIEWMPTQKNINSRPSYLRYLEALYALFKVHLVLRKKGIPGLLKLFEIQAKKHKKIISDVSIKKINEMAYILDRACIIYPKITKCLPWAGSLMYLLLKRGWGCSFTIGIQTNPFYAHAWVEVNEKVINDNIEVQERLAPIFKWSPNSETNKHNNYQTIIQQPING